MGSIRTFFVAVACIFVSIFAFERFVNAQTPTSVDVWPLCALNSAYLDETFLKYDLTERVMIISSLGRKERDKSLATKRGEVARKYFVNGFTDDRRRVADKVIVANSVDKAEKGRLDFYIKGELVFTFVFRRNQTFTLRPSCYSD